MDKGIYCLILRNPSCSIQVGALGKIAFEAGWHTYAGSALGSGGLKRLERHIGLAETCDRRPKWHVDYLLTDPHFLLSSTVFAYTIEKLECNLARALQGDAVPGFGCSDCRCHSHLRYSNYDPQDSVAGTFRSLGLAPVIKTIMSRQTKANA